MTKKRRRPNTLHRSAPKMPLTSGNGTSGRDQSFAAARHDAERDELRALFATLEEAARLGETPDAPPPAPAGAPPPARRIIEMPKRPAGVTEAQVLAGLKVRGLVHNAGLIEDFSGPQFGAVEDLTPTVAALEASVAAVQRGELGDAEALLMAQAATLNAIFARCATAASRLLERGQGEQLDRYLRLALKAQSQCRTTIETLAVLKNPTTIFARQANIAAGPQQVNTRIDVGTTGVDPAAPRSRTEGAPRQSHTSDRWIAPFEADDLPSNTAPVLTAPTVNEPNNPRSLNAAPARAEKSGRNELGDPPA